MSAIALNIFDYRTKQTARTVSDRKPLSPFMKGCAPAGAAMLQHGSFVLIDGLPGFPDVGPMVVRACLHQDDWELTARAQVSEHAEHLDGDLWHNCVIQQRNVVQDFGCYTSYIARNENAPWYEAVLKHETHWHRSLDMVRLIEMLKSRNPAMSKDAIVAAENELRRWYKATAAALNGVN